MKNQEMEKKVLELEVEELEQKIAPLAVHPAGGGTAYA